MKAFIVDNTEALSTADRDCIVPLSEALPATLELEVISYRQLPQLERYIQQTGAIAVIGSGVPVNKGYGIKSIEVRQKYWAPFIDRTLVSVAGTCVTHQAFGVAYGAELIEDGQENLASSKLP
jgi:hypothetical protein